MTNLHHDVLIQDEQLKKLFEDFQENYEEGDDFRAESTPLKEYMATLGFKDEALNEMFTQWEELDTMTFDYFILLISHD